MLKRVEGGYNRQGKRIMSQGSGDRSDGRIGIDGRAHPPVLSSIFLIPHQ